MTVSCLCTHLSSTILVLVPLFAHVAVVPGSTLRNATAVTLCPLVPAGLRPWLLDRRAVRVGLRTYRGEARPPRSSLTIANTEFDEGHLKEDLHGAARNIINMTSILDDCHPPVAREEDPIGYAFQVNWRNIQKVRLMAALPLTWDDRLTLRL